jgi:hypothetical protein
MDRDCCTVAKNCAAEPRATAAVVAVVPVTAELTATAWLVAGASTATKSSIAAGAN